MNDLTEKEEVKLENALFEEELIIPTPPNPNNQWEKINKFSHNNKQESLGLSPKRQTLRIIPRFISSFRVKDIDSNIGAGKIMKTEPKINHNSQSKFINLFSTLLKSSIFKQNNLMSNGVVRTWLEKQKVKRNMKKYKNLNETQIRILGDNSYQHEEKKDGLKKKSIFFLPVVKLFEGASLFYYYTAKQNLNLPYLRKFIPKIHPEGRFKLGWNIFICLCILYQFFTITIELFFDSDWDKINGSLKIVSYYGSEILKYLILFDIVMNMFTGYFHHGGVVMNSSKIFHHYVKNLMIIDILVIIPFFFEFDSQVDTEEVHISGLYSSKISIIKLLFIFRLFKLARTFYYIEKILSNNEKIEGILSLIKLCFKILFTAHLFACLWYFVGDYCAQKGLSNWIEKVFKNRALEDWRSYYTFSLYWSITTMITVGYGDITPSNTIEVAFVILYEIIGCGLFGYSLSNIGNIFEKLFAKENDLQANLRVINRFMKRKDIEFELQGKVRRYLDFTLREAEDVSSEKENELINRLSESLKKELLLQANGKILMNCPFLCQNFSVRTIERLTEVMLPMDLAPEDCIFEEGSRSTDQLFFVSKGKVDLYIYCEDSTKDSFLKIKRLQEGEVFGELSFITGMRREMSAVSVGYTKIFILKKQDFIDVLKEDSIDYEKLCSIRDNIILYSDLSRTFSPCASCKNLEHNMMRCPTLNYQPDRSFVVMKYIHKKKMRGSNHQRKKPKTHNALKIISKLNQLKQRLEEVYDLSLYEEELNELRNYMPEDMIIDFSPENLRLQTETLQKMNDNNQMDSENSVKSREEIEKSEEIEENFNRSKHVPTQKSYFVNKSPQETINLNEDGPLEKLTSLEACFVRTKQMRKQSKLVVKEATSRTYTAKSYKNTNTITSTFNKSKKKSKLFEDGYLFDPNFDIARNYKYYFPKNNFEEIVSRLRAKRVSTFSPCEQKKKLMLIDSMFYRVPQSPDSKLVRNHRKFKTVRLLSDFGKKGDLEEK